MIIIAVAVGMALLLALGVLVALVAISRRRMLRDAALDEAGLEAQARSRRQRRTAVLVLLAVLAVLALPLGVVLGGALSVMPVRRTVTGSTERMVVEQGMAEVSIGGGEALPAGEGPRYLEPTPTPADYVLPTMVPAPTPMPVERYPVPDGLRVAYVKDGDVWLWTADGRESRLLTGSGDVGGEVRLSDDGQLAAFVRAGELWVVPTVGGAARRLAAEDSLEGRVSRFEWAPDSHRLGFSTEQPLAAGMILNDDLHLIDADTLEHVLLLRSGEGGEFHFSPDGSRIAVVMPDGIGLIDADGGRRDVVLTYRRVETRSQYLYYPRPAWAADGSALRVAVPVAGAEQGVGQRMEIWHIPAKGGRARLVRSVTTAASLDLNVVSFSSDLGFVAYLQDRGAEGEAPERMESWLEVRRLGTEDVMASPMVTRLFGWAPDARHFAYVRGVEAPQLGIGQWSGMGYRGSVEAGRAVVTLEWLDAERYLVAAGERVTREPGGGRFELILADISGSSTVLAESTDLLAYDFAFGQETAQD